MRALVMVGIFLAGVSAASAAPIELRCDIVRGTVSVDMEAQTLRMGTDSPEPMLVKPTFVGARWTQGGGSVLVGVVVNRSTLELQYSSGVPGLGAEPIRFKSPCVRVDGKGAF
jgi:hypothetical protein